MVNMESIGLGMHDRLKTEAQIWRHLRNKNSDSCA